MRYPFIQQHEGQFSLSALCRVMKVARSGYYAWRNRTPSKREQADQQLTEQIKTVFEESDQTYTLHRVGANYLIQNVTLSGSTRRSEC